MESAMTITRDSLMTLEAYAKARTAMRDEVMAQKKLRRIALGQNILLIFENELLIRYQIQEMLRVEKIFEEDGIRHELDSYVPLVPTGSNFKVTMQIEYADEPERRRMLGLKGYIAAGVVEIEFEVDSQGKVHNARVVESGNANAIMEDCGLTAVQKARLPTMSAELRSSLEGALQDGRYRTSMTFYIY